MSELTTLLRDQQQRVDRVQHEVEALRVNGFSRMREVTAVVQGTGRIVSIAIDPDAVRRFDAYDLGEIVAEAVNDALDKLAHATRTRFASVLT